jgi:hypothetical protein
VSRINLINFYLCVFCEVETNLSSYYSDQVRPSLKDQAWITRSYFSCIFISNSDHTLHCRLPDLFWRPKTHYTAGCLTCFGALRQYLRPEFWITDKKANRIYPAASEKLTFLFLRSNKKISMRLWKVGRCCHLWETTKLLIGYEKYKRDRMY